jgi:flavin-dependent dehydrogenase
LDQEKYPGFFAWVIPSSNGRGKVGVAGKGIRSNESLEKFLSDKGKYSVIRKIYAPIWVNGPIKEFVSDNVVIIGDAAGQSKPTTAGGIYSCGAGGVFAGQAIAKFLKTGNRDDLLEYQKRWTEKFGKEFDKQILARKILGRLTNETINNLFKSITPEIINEISEKDDFDFHTGSIVKLLGVKGSLKTVQTIVGGEIKKLMR